MQLDVEFGECERSASAIHTERPNKHKRSSWNDLEATTRADTDAIVCDEYGCADSSLLRNKAESETGAGCGDNSVPRVRGNASCGVRRWIWGQTTKDIHDYRNGDSERSDTNASGNRDCNEALGRKKA